MDGKQLSWFSRNEDLTICQIKVKDVLPAAFFLRRLSTPSFLRWLHDAALPRDRSLPAYLQPFACAHADDYAVSAPSFRILMPATVLVVRSIDLITGMTANTKSVNVCRTGTTLARLPASNCDKLFCFSWNEGCKICQIYIGATIVPEGYLHRWTAPGNKFTRVCSEITSSPKLLVERMVDYKAYALPVLGFVGFLAAPDEATLKEESRALQMLAAGPYNAISTPMLMARTENGMGIDLRGTHVMRLAAQFWVATNSGTLALPRFRQRATACLSPFRLFPQNWQVEVCCLSLCVVEVCRLISWLLVDVISCVCVCWGCSILVFHRSLQAVFGFWQRRPPVGIKTTKFWTGTSHETIESQTKPDKLHERSEKYEEVERQKEALAVFEWRNWRWYRRSWFWRMSSRLTSMTTWLLQDMLRSPSGIVWEEMGREKETFKKIDSIETTTEDQMVKQSMSFSQSKNIAEDGSAELMAMLADLSNSM